MAKIQQLNLHKDHLATLKVGEIVDSVYLLQEIYYDKKKNYVAGVRKKAHFHGEKSSRAWRSDIRERQEGARSVFFGPHKP